jgi:hypothetical protein
MSESQHISQYCRYDFWYVGHEVTLAEALEQEVNTAIGIFVKCCGIL